jgi:hypothetical protein
MGHGLTATNLGGGMQLNTGLRYSYCAVAAILGPLTGRGQPKAQTANDSSELDPAEASDSV